MMVTLERLGAWKRDDNKKVRECDTNHLYSFQSLNGKSSTNLLKNNSLGTQQVRRYVEKYLDNNNRTAEIKGLGLFK